MEIKKKSNLAQSVQTVLASMTHFYWPWLANGPGQPLSAPCSWDGSNRDLRLTKLCLLSSVNNVTHHGHLNTQVLTRNRCEGRESSLDHLFYWGTPWWTGKVFCNFALLHDKISNTSFLKLFQIFFYYRAEVFGMKIGCSKLIKVLL